MMANENERRPTDDEILKTLSTDAAVAARHVARRLGLRDARACGLSTRLAGMAGHGVVEREWAGKGKYGYGGCWLYRLPNGKHHGNAKRPTAPLPTTRKLPPNVQPDDPDTRRISLAVVIEMYERVCPRTAEFLRRDLENAERAMALIFGKMPVRDQRGMPINNGRK